MQSLLSDPEKQRCHAYQSLYEEYVDLASFLWVLRTTMVKQPHYTLKDIIQLDQRIQSQFEALAAMPDQAWQACEQAMQFEQPGELFTSAVVAFRSRDVHRINTVVEQAMANHSRLKALASALAWLPDKLTQAWLTTFYQSQEPQHKYLALIVSSIKRQNPGEHLSRLLQHDDCKAHKPLYTRALRLVGELRRPDMMPVLLDAMRSDDDDILFWSSWSAILLGNKAAVKHLQAFIFNPHRYQQHAINIVFRVLNVEQSRQWIAVLAKDTSMMRAVIQASAVLGDPYAVHWLIQQMHQTPLARLAGDAFTSITGIDLQQPPLTTKPPQDVQSAPNDNPNNSNVDTDPDQNLPWPDPDKITALWQQQAQYFITGQRYLMGKPLTIDWLHQQILTARQPQRQAAALELVLMDANQPLINIAANHHAHPRI